MTRLERLSLFIVIAVLGSAPLLTYYFLVARVPSVTPAQLRDRLGDDSTLVIDVREAADFEQEHLPGAINAPLDALIDETLIREQSESIRAKDVFLICESGLRGARTVGKLRKRGVNAFNVAGGMAACTAAGKGFCPASIRSTQTEPPLVHGRFRQASTFEQSAVVLAAFGMKPAYMLLALILAVVLWRRPDLDLRALAWGMLFFFAGEAFCAVNYLLIESHDSFVLEYLHGFGMLLCFAFVVFAMFEGIDRRLIHVSDPDRRCAAASLCHGCSKSQPVSCHLERVFLFLGLAAALVAWMPWFTALGTVSYNSEIFGTVYNYAYPTVYQLYEMRYFPLVGSLAFLVGAGVLRFKSEGHLRSAKFLYAAGAGAIGFSFLRFGLFSAYRNNLLWADFWEEATELLFIFGVLFVLWVFRASLLGWSIAATKSSTDGKFADAIHTH